MAQHIDVDAFEAWMMRQPSVTLSHKRDVVRRVKRLADGDGITIQGKCFMQGIGFTLDMVTEELCGKAKQFAPRGKKDALRTNGQVYDTSNGWALHHPLCKLLMFKHETGGVDRVAVGGPPSPPCTLRRGVTTMEKTLLSFLLWYPSIARWIRRAKGVSEVKIRTTAPRGIVESGESSFCPAPSTRKRRDRTDMEEVLSSMSPLCEVQDRQQRSSKRVYSVRAHQASNAERTCVTGPYLSAFLAETEGGPSWTCRLEFPFPSNAVDVYLKREDGVHVVVEAKTSCLLHGLGQVLHYQRLARELLEDDESVVVHAVVALGKAPSDCELATCQTQGVHVWWPGGGRGALPL